jgi:hypothetical protein
MKEPKRMNKILGTRYELTQYKDTDCSKKKCAKEQLVAQDNTL